uniref:proton channel OTOP2-like isoform X2 n=1 Tax=Ciona intestinalis TaxID=7719 RepID=UPI000EF441CE|nr:proton channel OTOP2-like isoform X2 [Ciona intestinalis]|eukprot:XP_026693511.1 proton channel OTOP2-like isoform X2 [Ciona intestinalis]
MQQFPPENLAEQEADPPVERTEDTNCFEELSLNNWSFVGRGRRRDSISVIDQLSGFADSGISTSRKQRRMSGSVFSNPAFERGSGDSNDDVTPLGNNKYMIQRRGTKIFIHGLPKLEGEEGQTERGEEINIEETENKMADSFSWLMSGLYGLHIVLLALVLKVTQFVTEDITPAIIDYYYLFLYSLAAVLMIGYQPLVTYCYTKKEHIGFAKSHHVNNRWLKGVVATFGLAIIIKDGLEFIAFLGIDSSMCPDKALYASVPILHGLFIIVQVSFLFHYSKVFIQDFPSLSRFGVMHVVATNLSIWTATIIDETAGALLGHDEGTTATPTGPTPHLNHDNVSHNVPTYHAYSGLRARTPFSVTGASTSHGIDLLFTGNCTCDQEFCKTISVAESFLFPFLIEFSLVACCLLYVTWKNVGKDPPACQHIVKPSYKLYRSYRGVIAGCAVLFATVVIIIVLATTSSGLPKEQRTYYTENNFLLIYNVFMVTIQSLMTLACVCGFYLFWKTSHEQKQEGEDLDAALLLICLVGPILVETFSVLAIIVGDDNKIYGWIMSLGYPISDSIQCVGQVIFILYGLKREPLNTIETKETAEEVHRSVSHANALSTLSEIDEEGYDSECDVFDESVSNIGGRTSSLPYQHQRRDSVAMYAANVASAYSNVERGRSRHFNRAVKLKASICENSDDEPAPAETNFSSEDLEQNQPTVAVVGPMRNEKVSVQQGTEGGEITTSSTDAKVIETIEQPKRQHLVSITTRSDEQDETSTSRQRKNTLASLPPKSLAKSVKIVAETKIPDPNKTRLMLRDIIMFLLIANACLWMFWSLEGTAFVIYTYPYVYYGHSAWTTIAMVCKPLLIFFRMHSAACLFEMWSFA